MSSLPPSLGGESTTEDGEQMKPIKVFWSPLSHKFYASRAYKQVKPGVVEITGEKFDVTQDIAEQIVTHGITFTESKPLPPPTGK